MLTLLNCGQGQNGTYIDFLIQSFKERVLQDSGTFEAETESCLKDTLTVLSNID
jgi:hypothetical protein